MSGRAEDRPLVALSISRQQERKAAWSSRASASGPDRRKEKRFTSGSRASTGQGAENSSGNQNIFHSKSRRIRPRFELDPLDRYDQAMWVTTDRRNHQVVNSRRHGRERPFSSGVRVYFGKSVSVECLSNRVANVSVCLARSPHKIFSCRSAGNSESAVDHCLFWIVSKNPIMPPLKRLRDAACDGQDGFAIVRSLGRRIGWRF